MSKHIKKPSAVAQSSKAAHILIVDDEEDITEMLRRALSRNGIIVTVYNDPLMAISNFKAKEYDLAVFDIRMPGMSGFELLKKVSQVDKDLKVCFLTAFELEEDDLKRNGIDSDCINCFIKKPIRISDFLKRVHSMLEGI